MTDGIFRIKKKRFVNVKVFISDFIDGIIEGFKMTVPYGDVTDSPFELLTESPSDLNRNLHTMT